MKNLKNSTQLVGQCIKGNAFSLFVIFLFVYLFLLGGWNIFSTSTFFQIISNGIIFLVAHFAKLIVTLFGYNATYNNELQSIIIDSNRVFDIISQLGIKFYVVLSFILLLFPKNIKKSLLLAIIGFCSLIVLTAIRLSGEIMLIHTWSFWITNLVFYLRWVLILSILAKKIAEYPLLMEQYNKIATQVKYKFSIPLFVIILLSPIFLKLNHLIDTNAYIINTDFLLQFILQISKSFMFILGYQETIINNGNCLYLGINYVCVGFPCLGLGIMTSFTLLILLIRSHWLNKMLYILFGLVIMILMNSVRIVYLLIHLHKHQSYQLAMDAHDLSNYFFYIVVFLLFLGYILWFQYVPLFRRKVGC